MTQTTSNAASRYGTETDPFTPGEGDGFFFSTPALSQRLDLIQHLIEFSGQLVLVVGEEGSGKTTLLKQLLGRARGPWRTCHVQASPALDGCSLLRQMMEGYGLHPKNSEPGGDLMACLESLEVHLEACERSDLIPVLLVDDTQVLPPDTLTLLLTLLRPEEGRARLRAVLFAESMLLDKLNALPADPLREGMKHVLDIPAFTEEQACEYLRQRIDHAGLSQEILLNDAGVHRIYGESKGLPGRLLALARQAFQGGEGEEAHAESVQSPPALSPHAFLPRLKWQLATAAGLLALTTLVIVADSLMDDGPGRNVDQKEVVLDLPPPPAKVKREMELAAASDPETRQDADSGLQEPVEEMPTLEDSMMRDPRVESPGHPVSGPAVGMQAQDRPLSPPAEGTGKPEPAAIGSPANPAIQTEVRVSEVEPPSSPGAEETAVPPPASTTSPSAKPEPESEVTPSAPTKTPVATVKEAFPPAKPKSASHAPPVKEPLSPGRPDQYGLQLFGTHDKAGLENFLIRHGLRGKVMPLATTRNGRTWYVAVYGPFSDRRKAQAAIATLPPAVRALKPWPRSMASLRGTGGN